MTEHNGSDSRETIAPAEVSLNARPESKRSDAQQNAPWRQHRFAIAGLGIAFMALLGVVFLLPDLVAPVKPSETTSTPAADSEPPPAAQGPTESPWQDAQIAKARREAQEILEKLLDKQEELEEIRADLWASEAFAKAGQLAETADQHYRRQEFSEAQTLYRQSLQQFETLLERSESVFESAIAAGQQAIANGEATLAHEQFEVAGHIKPDHAAVETGLQRTAVLEEVLAEVDTGEELQRNGALKEAKQHYQAALELDAQTQLARQRLREVNEAIAERDFGENMSAGFAAMSENKHQEAINAFQGALKIKPDAMDARNALEQAKNEKTQTTLQTLLSAAKQHEQSEEWQSAVENYEKALELDENLVEARVGAIRAGTRADMDSKLERILASPQRLTTPAVHQEYQAFYEQARDINNPGPKLVRQLDQLQEALQQAVQPVAVEFRSDNATQVTLYKVGELGSFEATEMTLKPGTYTVVGTREGYRDVRQEFTVSAGSDRSPITVQCVEKISQG